MEVSAVAAKQYQARARKDGRFWLVEIPALDITGQARSLGEVDEVAREVAALVLDVDPDGIGVDVEVELPENLKAAWAQARRDLGAARQAQADAARESREVVAALRSAGYTYAEAAQALGLSPQRVQKIATSA
jgi:DNA-directed RNA polymerase specialized sigma24 family protein